MPKAFKRAGVDRRPDSVQQQFMLWHKARRSLVKTRVHLLNDADHLIVELPLELREQLPRTPTCDACSAVCEAWMPDDLDPVTALRLRLLAGLVEPVDNLDADERSVTRELVALVATCGSTLNGL